MIDWASYLLFLFFVIDEKCTLFSVADENVISFSLLRSRINRPMELPDLFLVCMSLSVHVSSLQGCYFWGQCTSGM